MADNMKDLPFETQEVLNFILSLDIEELSDDQKEFLMARRSYLNAEQKTKYSKLIKLHEEGKLVTKDEDESNLESLSLAKLKKIAKDEGVDIKKLVSVKEIAVAIKNAREDAE